VIRIFPERPPEQTQENARLYQGQQQDLERALVIQQLQDGQYYTAVSAAATAWQVGSEEHKRQRRVLQQWARKYLKQNDQNGVDKWSASEWRDVLFAQIFHKGVQVINQVCDQDDAHRSAGRLNMEYWFDPRGEIVLECNRDITTSPELPESHRVPNQRVQFKGITRVSEAGDNVGQTIKSRTPPYAHLGLIVGAIFFIFTALTHWRSNPERKYLSEEVTRLSVRDYLLTHKKPLQISSGVRPATTEERSYQWKDDPNTIGPIIEPPPFFMTQNLEFGPHESLSSRGS